MIWKLHNGISTTLIHSVLINFFIIMRWTEISPMPAFFCHIVLKSLQLVPSQSNHHLSAFGHTSLWLCGSCWSLHICNDGPLRRPCVTCPHILLINFEQNCWSLFKLKETSKHCLLDLILYSEITLWWSCCYTTKCELYLLS